MKTSCCRVLIFISLGSLAVASAALGDTSFRQSIPSTIDSRILNGFSLPSAPSPFRTLSVTGVSKPEAPAKENAFSLGFAYVDSKNGADSWNLPYEYAWESGTSKVSIQSDGFTHSAGAGGVSGFSDPTFLVQEGIPQLSSASNTVLAVGGVTIPVRGQAGSKSLSERFSLIYAIKLSETTALVLIGGVQRFEGDVSTNGRYAQSFGFQAKRGFSGRKDDVKIEVVNVHRNGGRNITVGKLYYDLPLRDSIDVSAQYSRVLAKGLEADGVEVDLAFKF